MMWNSSCLLCNSHTPSASTSHTCDKQINTDANTDTVSLCLCGQDVCVFVFVFVCVCVCGCVGVCVRVQEIEIVYSVFRALVFVGLSPTLVDSLVLFIVDWEFGHHSDTPPRKDGQPSPFLVPSPHSNLHSNADAAGMNECSGIFQGL